MVSFSRSHLAVYAAVAAAIVLIGARYLHKSSDGGGGPGESPGRAVPVRVSDGGGAGGKVVIQVAGEVRRPGVYRLAAGSRVDDAVRLAGGPTGEADLAGVNLAAKAEDGRQVIVPARTPAAGVARSAAPSAGGSGTASASAPAQGGATAGNVPLNLNTATVEQLDQLEGIGPLTAQKIVAYRQQHGGFRSVAELDRVPGIGPTRLAALRERVTV